MTKTRDFDDKMMTEKSPFLGISMTNDDKNDDTKIPKKSYRYSCDCCQYITKSKKDYNKHLTTAKHKKMSNGDKIPIKRVKQFECECGNSYASRQSLHRHKKQCYLSTDEDNNDNNDDHYANNDKTDYKDLFIDAMKTMKEQQEQINKMIPLIGNNNNNTTNNMTNNFNLNFFLNDTCKDALNLTDFIESIQVQLKDLEYTTDNGHIKGITNIFHNALNNLEIEKRPMHCTDLKREVLYIKDNNEWHKDEDKDVLRTAVTKVVDKNLSNSEKWLDEHPNVLTPNSKDSARYIKMTENSLGTGLESEQNKIVKNILKEVTIDK